MFYIGAQPGDYKRWRFDHRSIIHCVSIDNVCKTESIRKLSNFNFRWTKTLYQNNLNNIGFFSTLISRAIGVISSYL